MKILLHILLMLLTTFALAQRADFQKEMTSDSLQCELRLWVSNFFTDDKFIQITQNKEGIWRYHVGYNTENGFKYHDSIVSDIDWTFLQAKLDSFNLDELPSQEDIELNLVKNDKVFDIENEKYFSSILDGIAYTLEIFDNKIYRTIYYNNPQAYIKSLKATGLSTKEHERFISFLDFMSSTFNLKELTQIQMRKIQEGAKKGRD